jgi:molybdopterin-containing oxidoreductase family iron-sulfur binding subunit
VWDNVALMSPATARELGVEVTYDAGHYYADRVAISAGGERIELPVWVQPGYPDGTVGLNYGYGRAISMSPARSRRETPFWDRDDYTDVYGYGPIAGGVDEATGEPKGTVGVNVAPLAPARGRVVTGATVEKAGGDPYEIVTTQEHGSMEGRPIIRWATLDEYKENPDFPASMGAPVPGSGHDDGHGDGHGGDGHDGDSHGGDHSGDGAAHGTSAAFATPVTTVSQEHGGEQAHGEQAHGGDGSHGGDGAGGYEREGDAGYRDYPMPWESRHPKDSKAYADNAYYDNQWGMVIDLNTCTGCNACVVACTSENNVQVVGKEEVSRGRHMYWLRMDRYYVSDTTEADDLETDDWRAEEDPAMMMQPVMCQHCENAPCESVCPVAATVHSPDGTNQMIYNRCIGTRYCSNNCPYKVRRFNFYNWTKTLPLEVQMAQNPNVSVRFRGVMEKCSFCIHRVRHAQRRANNEMRSLKDGEVQTACQQACPADAIVFGDLNNPDSRVVQEKANSRRYELLAQLNVKPRLSYLGRVRNTNPRLEAAPGEPAMADAAEPAS